MSTAVLSAPIVDEAAVSPTEREWATGFRFAEIPTVVSDAPDASQVRVHPISVSGFELKHLYTSRICSG